MTILSMQNTHVPVFVSPPDGSTLDYNSSYSFEVEPVTNVSGFQGFLWGFFQNGVLVWENLRDEKALSSNSYSIPVGSIAHSKFVPGDIQVWVRTYVNNQSSDAAIITVHLKTTIPSTTCDTSTQYSIPYVGCIKKNYVIYGAVGFFALMLLSKGKR